MNNYLSITITVTLVLILLSLVIIYSNSVSEPFNDSVGQFCQTCSGKTFNQCTACFNCGFCIDRFGNSKCVGADVNSGAYNKEDCALLYVRDPFGRAKLMNTNYKCSYGPMQGNRVI